MARMHQELDVWKRSIDLVTAIYLLTNSFPDSEIYNLTSQMRRSAVSVPSNLAEGAARASKKDFLKFLAISRGSLSELETQLIISRNLGYISEKELMTEQIEEIFGLMGGLIRSLKLKV